MKEITIGMVGFGFMGKMHTYGYKTIPLYYEDLPFKIRLKWVCTSNEETAKKAMERGGFEQYTTDFDDLIKDNDVDIIDICTPNLLHKDEIIKALKSGKKVYCDKPLTVTYDEAKEVVDAENETGNTINQVTFHNRFYPATLKAKKLMEEGKIGKVLTFEGKFLHSGNIDATKGMNWKQDKEFGGGVLRDLGSHVIDIIYYLIGEFDEIFCRTQNIRPTRLHKDGSMCDTAGEDSAYMSVVTKDGAVGNITCTKVATGSNDELSFAIYGEKGAIRFSLMDSNYLEYFDNTLSEEALGGMRGFKKIECVQRYEYPAGVFPSPKSSIGWMRGHVHCLYSFLDCVYNNKKPSPSFQEAAYVQYIMDKAYESAEGNMSLKV
ncbi:MAG: Gfo/Idh/MocA family oxidoreductase [Ruminococcaceae bacterium]|nr:Gfo/Idh/MocA family oxidoreductase [Oscillospiraceae bacterium]